MTIGTIVAVGCVAAIVLWPLCPFRLLFSLVTHTAAAPSPNMADPIMSALRGVPAQNDTVQASTATISTFVPSWAAAKSRAIARPETPPAQPSPKTGMRITSSRNPISRWARASSVGVAMPVEDTVTIASTSSASQPASSRAPAAALINSCVAPSRYTELRSGQDLGVSNQDTSATA